jgi:hypothetical protein
MKRCVTSAVCLALLGACVRQSDPPGDPVAIVPRPDDRHAGCLLGVPHTRVQITDTKEGVALTFTTWNRIDELRHRVRDAAAMHGPHTHIGLGHAGQHELGQGHGLRLADMPVGRATVDDVELGARLQLDAIDGLRVADLRSQIRTRIDDIRLGHPCDGSQEVRAAAP